MKEGSLRKNPLRRLIKFFKILNRSFVILKNGHPLILAASTAFFATFSISPTIIIFVSILSFYFKEETISKELFATLSLSLGTKAAQHIETIVNNFKSLKSNTWITIGGFVFLMFVATTLLIIMQQSIHMLWHISYKSNINFGVKLRERIKATVVLLFMGFLFIFSLLLDTSVSIIQEYLQSLDKDLLSGVIWILNVVFSIFIITIWFAILFKVLPDAHLEWQIALKGGLLTACCTYFGRMILGKILVQGNITTIFGASASFALILLFIFYSSFIIYFGAAFTYAYGEATGKPVVPDKFTNQFEEKVIGAPGTAVGS